MRLVIDNLQTFAERVKSGLGEADWTTRRELIRMLVKRIEIEKEQVRLVYKMDIRPFERGPERGFSQDCTLRGGATAEGDPPSKLGGRLDASTGN
jgi:site-specific DNA recombinase